MFDESSAYFELNDNNDNSRYVGKAISGRPHFYYEDKRFIEVIIKNEIDYFIWFSPYKLINTINGRFDMPSIVVYDLSHIDFPSCSYDISKMVSVEL